MEISLISQGTNYRIGKKWPNVCIRGGLYCVLGKMSSPKRLSGTGTGGPGKWWRYFTILEVFKRCVVVALGDMVLNGGPDSVR